MSTLQIALLIGAIIALFLIAFLLKKNQISIKYSVMWLLLPIAFVLMILFEEPLAKLSSWFGFEVLSNFVFVVIFTVIILICFGLTVIVSRQKKQIIRLIQDVAILKEKSHEKKK